MNHMSLTIPWNVQSAGTMQLFCHKVSLWARRLAVMAGLRKLLIECSKKLLVCLTCLKTPVCCHVLGLLARAVSCLMHHACCL